ncbi:MAG TPA: 4Fe-4S dicluster domain-containing protein [Desulfomonilaceae bacterium]|nr:4Fe-4S dicluster domain-containing protein [Desulfomonilaceae bacterium]
MSTVEQQTAAQPSDIPAGATVRTDLVPIFIMGKKYDVPSTLTIQKAFEFAGYQLIRGCGCRGGICGACATVYRLPGSPKIHVGLACQTVVEPNMYLAMVPFFPANRAVFDLEELKPDAKTLLKYYPELAKCMGCNTCTKSCPMEIPVMEYISAALRGDVEKAAEISMPCVMCGICTSRCPAELAQYHIAMMSRRITGRHIRPQATHLQDMIHRIESGRYEESLKKLMTTDLQTLRKLYVDREMEPHTGDEMWEPAEKQYL